MLMASATDRVAPLARDKPGLWHALAGHFSLRGISEDRYKLVVEIPSHEKNHSRNQGSRPGASFAGSPLPGVGMIAGSRRV
jgi:hypothetical protein